MSDEPVAPCPECGQAAERLISKGAGLLFRGEGFYITENRSESYKKKAEKESSSPSDAGPSDAKPSSGEAASGPADAKASD